MRYVKAWLPVVVYGLFIYLLSALLKPGNITHPWDWFLHFFEFIPFGFFITRALLLSKNMKRSWAILGGALLGFIFGLLDEFHQSFVIGRDATLIDALVDGLGALAGAFSYPFLGQWLFRRRKLYQSRSAGCNTCPIAES